VDPGSTAEQETNNFAQMVVADVVFDKAPPLSEDFYAVVSPTSFLALTPIENLTPRSRGAHWQEETIYRLACGVPPSDGEAPPKAGLEYCQHLIDTYGPHTLNSDKSKNPDGATIERIVWSTRFRTRYSAAETFFTFFGNDSKEAGTGGSRGAKVCLVGDAAHIHPPAGGQGMNLGLRDGISLGPVIASALTAGSSPESDEKVRAHMAGRRERALKVIGATKAMSHAVGMSPVLQSKFWWSPIPIHTVRDWALWMLSKSSFVRDTLAYKFSGLEDRQT
jgi:2-polyprenyl-6-methoxyphenol hydroxylase-like FAD-dependent oxidoreductase